MVSEGLAWMVSVGAFVALTVVLWVRHETRHARNERHSVEQFAEAMDRLRRRR